MTPASDSFDVVDTEYLRVDGHGLLARIHRPKHNASGIGVVDVHGGAWMQNDRTQNGVVHAALASAGVTVCALDFRMPPAAAYPAAVQDVNYGIRWFKTRAATFGVKNSTIGILASSSGGHLAMLNALRPADPLFSAPRLDGPDASVAFAALLWPVLDPLARYRMVKAAKTENLIKAHDAFFRNEQDMSDANPQLVLERGEAEALPPTMIVQGTADTNLTPDMSDKFVATYRGLGGNIVLHPFEGQPHTFIAKDPNSPASQRAIELVVDFAVRQGR